MSVDHFHGIILIIDGYMAFVPMDISKSYIKKMFQELTKLNSGEVVARTRY
jgi:hypothetical protein